MNYWSHIAAATALIAAPVAASAQAPANPAASLSVSKSVRAGTATSKRSNLFGGGTAAIFAVIIVAGIAAILVIDGTNGNNSDSP